MNILLYYVIILIREYKFILPATEETPATPIPIFLPAGDYCECAQRVLRLSTDWRSPVMELFITILQLICGLIVIGIVLFQSGKSAGLSGAIGGVADSFMAKNKAKSMDAKLARATKWVGAAFIVLTLVLNML